MTTLGEQRVRVSFNPSGNTEVNDIKRRAADCIDWCEDHKQRDATKSLNVSEVNRMLALAQTAFEEAAMWAVKSVTG